VLLLAAGLLSQLELGLGAPESSWLRHAGKTGALLAIGAGAFGLLRALRPGQDARPLPQARVELALLCMSGVALLFLLLQVAFGDETGVFDLQPVEFAKLALAALSAHCLALATSGQPVPGGLLLRVLRLGAPALLFLVLLAVALVQVDDYSPLILLTVWGCAMALAYALASRKYLLLGAVLAAALAAVAGVALLRAAGPGEFARWNFYADRFMVWLDPGSHPHTGQQLLLGAQAIAGGGWFGADHAFGLLALGQDAGAALRIPAVQDDFAPSFFLNRHGLVAALLLWMLQALFLASLLHTAVRCWLSGAGARDFRLAWFACFCCFLLCGGATFVAGHFLLSWGTNLAIFPVMGQPMSFLSAGGSHLLFFICPLLVAAVASEPEHH
jgi:cell division protein FtsW